MNETKKIISRLTVPWTVKLSKIKKGGYKYFDEGIDGIGKEHVFRKDVLRKKMHWKRNFVTNKIKEGYYKVTWEV